MMDVEWPGGAPPRPVSTEAIGPTGLPDMEVKAVFPLVVSSRKTLPGVGGHVALRTHMGRATIKHHEGIDLDGPAVTILPGDQPLRLAVAAGPLAAWGVRFCTDRPEDLPVGHAVPVPHAASEDRHWFAMEAAMLATNDWERRAVSARFMVLMCDWLARDTRRGTRAPGQNDDVVATVIERMCADFGLTVSELAASVGLGDSALRQRFRKATGFTPKQYHTRLRSQRAIALLEAGWSVADTAAALAYADPFHFSNAFSKMFMVPPSAIMRKPRPIATPKPLPEHAADPVGLDGVVGVPRDVDEDEDVDPRGDPHEDPAVSAGSE